MIGKGKSIFNTDEAMILMLYQRDTRTATIANLRQFPIKIQLEQPDITS